MCFNEQCKSLIETDLNDFYIRDKMEKDYTLSSESPHVKRNASFNLGKCTST